MDGHSNETKLIDARMGGHGQVAWILVVGLPVLFYALYSSIEVIFTVDESNLTYQTIILISSVTSVWLSVLILGSVSCIFQGVMTAQRITIIDGSSCVVCCYYGREIQFKQSEVRTVTPFELRMHNKIITPLDGSGINYRITLNNGVTFHVNGSMLNVDKFLSFLNGPVNPTGSVNPTV